MDDNIISRVEEKYLISPAQKARLLARIEKRFLAPDRFFKEEVLSVYFDTDDFKIANRSIDRPDFRLKLRVRSYNTPKKSSPVFFEIKSKLANTRVHVGNKRRLVIFLSDLYKFLDKSITLEAAAEKYVSAFEAHKSTATIPATPFAQRQFARELDYLLSLWRPKPRILISSDRLAYTAMKDSSFRLTFDENLRFRTDNLRLEKGSAGEPYFPKKTVIMEVKTMSSMPLWFVQELSRLKIRPARFSKYGKIYQHLFESSTLPINL